MAKSIGIVLAATGISFANDWMQTDKPNLRIPVAGLGVALLFSGIERMNTSAAVGLSWIMMITVLVTPVHGNSPVESVNNFLGQPSGKERPKQSKPTKVVPH